MLVPGWLTHELDAGGVRYHLHHHDPEYTAQAVARSEHTSPARFAKVVVVIADGKPVLLVLPAYARVDFNLALTALGAREVRLAREEELARVFPDVDIGAIPPLRHWPGVELWMDRSLVHDGQLMFQAGTHQDAAHVDFQDWMRVAQPRIAEFVRPSYIGA